MALAFLTVLVAGAGVYFFVHTPLSNDIDRMRATNTKLRRQNAEKKKRPEKPDNDSHSTKKLKKAEKQ